MDLNDAKRQWENAFSKLEQMENQRGNHDAFANLATEFLERAQSGFESAVDDWGSHGGNKPQDPLLQWVFDIVNDDRHGSQPVVSHADISAPRSPREFQEDVEVIMETREGGHAYFFPQQVGGQAPIPDDYKKTRVTEVAKIILHELLTKIETAAEGGDIQPSEPLANQDQRDDHLT